MKLINLLFSAFLTINILGKDSIKIINDSDEPIKLDYLIPSKYKSIIIITEIDSYPKAKIVDWFPGIRCSGSLAHNFVHERPLPIWVSITFDKEVNGSFLKKFTQFLNTYSDIKPATITQHRRDKGRFLFTVPRHMTREEVERIINEINEFLM